MQAESSIPDGQVSHPETEEAGPSVPAGAPSAMRIGIIIGSTRPGRLGESVAKWVYDVARKRSDAEFEIVDLKDYHLPLLDEPLPPSMGKYTKEHTRAWANTIASLDAFVFVTPEYGHSFPAALKNALDFLSAEWRDKAAGFVSYGSLGGVRAVEALRPVMGSLQIADVRSQVSFSIFTDFENFQKFRPEASKEQQLNAMLDQVVAWGSALRPLHAPVAVPTVAALA